MWALGRAAEPAVMKEEGYEVIGPGDIPLSGETSSPRPLTIPEIKQFVGYYATAAANAVHGAGFDGVEVHGANGYFIDQFIQTNTNNRTDEYGGSIENRIRFILEVVDAVTKVVGQERTGVRLSPWSPFQEMRMPDPIPTFSTLISRLREQYDKLAFLHVVEPRVSGGSEYEGPSADSNDFIQNIWSPRPLIKAGGFARETSIKAAESEGNVLVAIGRHFISNPDLPARFKNNQELTPYDRSTFYSKSAVGYADWPVYQEARL